MLEYEASENKQLALYANTGCDRVMN